MPIYQKGTSSWTTVNDMYICTGASAFTRICKVYICVGPNDFRLVYDGCGFACDGYYISGQSCPATRTVNYYGIGNADSSNAQTKNLTYSNNYTPSGNYWNMRTYQCSSCPPPGNVIIEYQTCPNTTGTISPYLFVNRGLDQIGNYIESCFISETYTNNVVVASVNSYLPLINNLTNSSTTSYFGNDPGVCTCVDEQDWKIPSSIQYITTKTGNSAISITENNTTWSTPSGLNCDDTSGFRENLIPSSSDYSKSYSKYGIFWGADDINTASSCPIYCYGTSGGSSSGNNVEGYACKSVAKLPLILGVWDGTISSSNFTNYISSDIKYNNNTTSTNRSTIYRLFNLGFGVKISSGSPKWKMKITYPVYFSEKELEDLYGLTTSNYTLGSEYEWTQLFNAIPSNTSKTYFDLLMMKPLTQFFIQYESATPQFDIANMFWHRSEPITGGGTPAYPAFNSKDNVGSYYLDQGTITNKPVYCLSIEVSGDGNGICSAALYSGSDPNRKIKLQPMTNSSGILFDQYQMFTLTDSNSNSGVSVNASIQEVYNNTCTFQGGDSTYNPSTHAFLDGNGTDYAALLYDAFGVVKNYWSYTKQITLSSSENMDGTSSDCSGEDD